MVEIIDKNKYEGDIDPGSVEDLIVKTRGATHCTITVDGGERGSVPAPYHLFWRAHIDDGWQPQQRHYDIEEPAHAFPIPDARECRVGVSNESDERAHYRICFFSFRV